MADDQTSGLRAFVEVLGSEIDGWRLSVEPTYYGPKNLFDYIDGGAELYLSYGFGQMVSLIYARDAAGEINVDIFDMGSPASAYGVFAHSREAIDDFVGPEIESEYAGGLLTFWKGSFYVSILAYPETQEKRQLVQRMARLIADRITEKSEKPAILALLPAEDLDPLSVRYFRHHLWVNSYGFIAQENALRIGPDTEAVLAKYRQPERPQSACVLLLVAYRDRAGAEVAYESHVRLDSESGVGRLGPRPDSAWSGGRVEGRFLAIVVGAPSPEQGQELLTGISERIVRGSEPAESKR